MKCNATVAALAQLGSVAQSTIVSGTAPGFAAGVTGGGDATPVYPSTIAELKSYLTSKDPQNIVINGTFDFVGSEGTTTYSACDSYSCTPSEGGQSLLNTLDGCGSNALHDVTLDTAGVEGINVASNKTLVGTGTNAVLNGKGLRFAGVSNIIVQNIAITNLNPQYVWGGDAFVFADTDLIWVDHVTTSNLGRQHYSFGQKPDSHITISNSFINGATNYSATCDGHTYWALELVGTDDSITFYNNYVYKTSGRSPALSGKTLFHAVNSVWEDNSGHALEGTDEGMGLFEGCVFNNVSNIADSGFVGSLFAADSADSSQCKTYLGRACQANLYVDSGAFDFDDTDFFSNFEGMTVVSASSASSIETSVPANAGNTLKA